MAINEVFPNPTVKEVIFQIAFPNLFYIENKVGDFQIAIMDKFSESSVAYRRLFFGDIGPDVKLEDIPHNEQGKSIWQFFTPGKEVRLNLTSNSLDITSSSHKTYNLEGGIKFRDVIEFVLEKFFSIISIPVINRVGLRYIDNCPLPSKDIDTLKSYYNSTFPFERFDLENTTETLFRAVTKCNGHFMTYSESLKKIGDSYRLLLDFDGFAQNIPSQDLLPILDSLHETISNEFEKTIKEPVYDYMRQDSP